MEAIAEHPERISTRTVCPICESDQFYEIYNKKTTESPVRDYLEWRYPKAKSYPEFNISICKCKKCKGFFHKNYVKYSYNEDTDTRDDYDILLKKHLSSYGKGVAKNYSWEIQFVLGLFPNPSDTSVLDFGAGWGGWCLMAKAFGFNADGVEVDDAKVNLCRKRAIDILDLDELPDSKYSFINAEQVFEHLESPLSILSRLSKSLVKGGVVRISVPNSHELETALLDKRNWSVRSKTSASSLNCVWPFEHINAFTNASMVEMGKMAGLAEFKISPQQYFRLFKRNMPALKRLSRWHRNFYKKKRPSIFLIKL